MKKEQQELYRIERKSHLTDPERETQNREGLFQMKQRFVSRIL